MTAVDLDALDAARVNAALGSLRVGEHYGIHLYAGENPVGTTLRAADAALIVAAVNALPDLIADARKLRALRDAVEAIVDEMEDDESIGIPPNVPLLIAALRATVTAALDPS